MAQLFVPFGGTDGGGIQILVVGGKIIIKPVPPWGPEIMREIQAAAQIAHLATQFADKKVQEQGVHFAQQALQHRAGEIENYVAEGNG